MSESNKKFLLSSWSWDLPDTTKIWVKLCFNSISRLDKFYRDLDGGSATRTSPFYIYTKHRMFNDYFEFYKIEYEQIFDCYDFNNEILTPEEMEERFNMTEQIENEQFKLEL
jgi:hypothetical protein